MYFCQYFNNREIAIGIWCAIVFIYMFFYKDFRSSLHKIIKALLSYKIFMVFGLLVIYFYFVILILRKTNFWETDLLKDTLFWLLFVEIPIFISMVENARNKTFFKKLIIENLKISAVLEFILNYWTFDLWIELLVFPFLAVISLMIAMISKDKEKRDVLKFLESFLFVYGIVIVIFTFDNIINNSDQLVNMFSLKSFLLPNILLLFMIPFMYGVALYNYYDQMFVYIKNNKFKIMWLIFSYIGLNLNKVYETKISINGKLLSKATIEDIEKTLININKKFELKVGENYMKRSNYYVIIYVVCFVFSTLGVIYINSDVTLQQIIDFDFVIKVDVVKEILNYILSATIAISLMMLLFSIGMRKKKYEEISNIKKFALLELLTLIKMQNNCLLDIPPIDNAIVLFTTYVKYAYEINIESTRVIERYSNLLTNWELDIVRNIQVASSNFMFDVFKKIENPFNFDVISFEKMYRKLIDESPQTEKLNVYQYNVQKSAEKYADKIIEIYNEFENIIEKGEK